MVLNTKQWMAVVVGVNKVYTFSEYGKEFSELVMRHFAMGMRSEKTRR